MVTAAGLINSLYRSLLQVPQTEECAVKLPIIEYTTFQKVRVCSI